MHRYYKMVVKKSITFQYSSALWEALEPQRNIPSVKSEGLG